MNAIRIALACVASACAVPAACAQPTIERSTTFGVELDALPYINKGYYGSVWLGRDRWRYRVVATRTNLPGFLVDEGFDDARLDVVAGIIDLVPQRGYRGPWVGVGAERWHTRARNEVDGARGSWNNTVATLGGGYIWKFAGNLYLNPWAAGHLVVGGPRRIAIGNRTYVVTQATPEASLKLGWHF